MPRARQRVPGALLKVSPITSADRISISLNSERRRRRTEKEEDEEILKQEVASGVTDHFTESPTCKLPFTPLSLSNSI